MGKITGYTQKDTNSSNLWVVYNCFLFFVFKYSNFQQETKMSLKSHSTDVLKQTCNVHVGQ